MKKDEKKQNPLLGIIIPAYKVTYLHDMLQSLADQTNKGFRVYIGDDGSPQDIQSVVSLFTTRLDLIYKRFENNLGSVNLVSHWERCVEMADQEEWLWFFSDDDRMDPDCVALFYRSLPEFDGIDLVHFNVKQIDNRGKIINAEQFADFPEHYCIEDFCHDRLMFRQQSYIVEFIFRKSKFFAAGRFQQFDLAWGADVATCIKVGWPGGIATIPDAYVYFRLSGQNISSINSKVMISRKMAAVVDFLEWLDAFTDKNGIHIAVNPFVIYIRRLILFRGRLGPGRIAGDLLRLLKLRLHLRG